MKGKLLKIAVAASTAAMICNCSDDSSPSTPIAGSSASAEQNICGSVLVTSPAYVMDIGGSWLVIYPDGKVTDGSGNVAGSFDGSRIFDIAGQPKFEVDVTTLLVCEANATVNPDGSFEKLSSSSAIESSSGAVIGGDNPDLPSEIPTSSASEGGIVIPGSSAALPSVESSSSITPTVNPGEKFPSIESYGPPPAEYTKNILGNGKTGWNTRYWDACKPHCSWISNGAEGKTDTTTQESYVKGLTTARNCNIHDVEVPTFTLGHAVQQYWMGFEGTTSACEIGAAGVFTCTDMAPIAVNDTLAYAYVAGPSSSICGKCYHLQYDGSFKDENANNAPKETHKALKGKHIIVMSSNIGHDVKDGQFDLMVPGGGVGIFDALSVQVNGANVNWGEQYGGFLTECQKKLGHDKGLNDYQTCVKDMCDAAFGNANLPNLLRGCHWFADWYMAADNPTYNWEEVECPQYLLDHYLTTINTEKSNRFEWHDDWSTYKEGDVLDTLECLSDEYPQGCKTNK